MPDSKQPPDSQVTPAKQLDKYPERKFLIGTAISVFQNSGDPNSNWAWWEKQKKFGFFPTIAHGARSGKSCNLWERYEEDFKLAAGLGSNAMRISLEWSRIEPQRGKIDEGAIQHYHAMFDCLERNGMEPLVTLHHFVHPQWFDELGGFAKEENIDIFLGWVRLAFENFGKRIRSWSTFNEPGCFASSGYISGLFPPGKMFQFTTAGVVLLNLMKAHGRAYHLIKSLPGGEDTRIGIVHNFMRYEQYKSRYARFAPWTAGLVWLADHVWGNEVVLKYLMSGYFDWYPMWPLCRVHWRNPKGRPPLDWVGLNYYGRIIVTAYCMPTCYPWELLSDLDQGLHPEGFYHAIQDFAALERPIYIMETGIADAKDDKRGIWADTYFRALEQAVMENYDVRGLMYWTLMDNFEWAFGYVPKFGLYKWDHTDPEGKRIERESVKTTLRNWFKTLPAVVERQWAINAKAHKEPLPA